MALVVDARLAGDGLADVDALAEEDFEGELYGSVLGERELSVWLFILSPPVFCKVFIGNGKVRRRMLSLIGRDFSDDTLFIMHLRLPTKILPSYLFKY